jgi:hypothetical protein
MSAMADRFQLEPVGIDRQRKIIGNMRLAMGEDGCGVRVCVVCDQVVFRDEIECIQLYDTVGRSVNTKVLNAMQSRLRPLEGEQQLCPVLLAIYDCGNVHASLSGLLLARGGFASYDTVTLKVIIYNSNVFIL